MSESEVEMHQMQSNEMKFEKNKVAKYASQALKKILKEKQEAKERPSKSIDVANRKPLFSVSNFRRDRKT